MRCGHCGNKTALEERGSYPSQEPELDIKGDVVWKPITRYLLECSTCTKPTLVEINLDENLIEIDHYILYPSSPTPLTDLPQKIEKAYTAAIKVKNIEPNACAVLVGRTLEAACNYEQAQGRTLAQKLNYLAQNGRIPNTLAEMAHQLKELRNLGAHDAEDEVTENDVPIIVDFLEAILEYLYVAPEKN
jgi:hypothetical protein